MIRARVLVRELAAWDFDNYEYRSPDIDFTKLAEVKHLVKERPPFQDSNAVLAHETTELHEAFLRQAGRPDLLAEMTGLNWSLGVIDLRCLIAFQRRLSFHPQVAARDIPAPGDWSGLLALSFGSAQPVVCELSHDASSHTIMLRSSNANVHFRITNRADAPLGVHAGSPFFEVACFRERWFLRDGYHRAYALLRKGVFEVPAVIVQAKTIEELGATQPWFFPEEVLFSSSPPFVTDFLDSALTLDYDRLPLVKTLRIMMEETLAPATHTGEST